MGKIQEDYFVAQWYTETDEFQKFLSNNQNQQPALVKSISNPSKNTLQMPTRTYVPFEDESILFKILNIDPRNTDESIAFYNEYGPLDQMSSLSNITPTNRCSNMEGILESRNFFINSVIEIKTIVDGFFILEDIKAGAIFTETEQFELLEHYNPSYWQPRREYLNTRFEDIIQMIIVRTLSSNLKSVSPFAELDKDGNFYPGYISTNLLGAIWLQIYNLVTRIPGKQVFKECLFCGKKFASTSSRQKFCPEYSDIPVKNTPCANRYSAMQNRARKWYRGGLKTIDEIAEQLNRPVPEVKLWLKLD
jgi:hypothetical protein